MPHYDYVHADEARKPAACPQQFVLNQPMSDDPLASCPACGEPVRRKIGKGIGVIFRGSGFYETDYKRLKKTPPAAESGGVP